MMTQVSADDLRSIDLRKAAATAESECVRCSETVGADHIEIVDFPESNRAGVAAGANADWTDASSVEDALDRYQNDRMSP